MVEIENFIYCIIKYGKIQNFIINNNSNDIEQLRKFHNFIKSQLIINSCQNVNAKYLLDIACGRGGDLQKWLNNKINLKYILAFDSHKESIYSSIIKGDNFDGAISRFLNIKKNYKKLPFINFKNFDILDPNILYKLNYTDSNAKYDVISCQFALHYFCKSDTILDNVLFTISSKLKPGGLFIGTATDGDLINNILNYGNVNIPLLSLITKNKNNYLFYINTDKSKKITRQNYFELQGVSSEFFLFKQQLKTLAEKNNLILIEYKSFYDWYNEYLIFNKTKYQFEKMSTYELLISFLNFSFIFKKI